MDIGFSEEQELLRDTARKFLDSECDTRFVRGMMATETAVTPEFWAKLAANGWLGITYPEADGGAGLGLIDLVVLMEEVGRAVMPMSLCLRWTPVSPRSPESANVLMIK